MSVLCVGYVHPGVVRHEFMDSVLATVDEWRSRQRDIYVRAYESGPLLARARNLVLEQFLATPATHLLFVDTDMSWGPQDVGRVLQQASGHPHDIIGGLYFDKMGGPVAFKYGLNNEFVRIENIDSSLIQVAGLGMGFTLIGRNVVEALKPDAGQLWPFAEVVRHKQRCGEDLTFCFRAAEMGFQCWLATNVRVRHMKTVAI